MRGLIPLTVLATSVICGVVVTIILTGGLNGTVPANSRPIATATPRVATPRVASPNASQVARATASTSGSHAAGTASAVPSATAETRDRVTLRTDALVAQPWTDSAGTVRVHVVVSATNDTSDVVSLAAAERAFELINGSGQAAYTGRFAYAFPFVVPPGSTSYLITTVVLPIGVDATDLRVEAQMLGDVTTAAQPMLEVSDLRLETSDGRVGVRGLVRNTGAEDVTFGVVAVIGRNLAGRVVGGWYDIVNVASIAAGGEATFQTEYPGLPPEWAGRIAGLSGVAFDAGTSLP